MGRRGYNGPALDGAELGREVPIPNITRHLTRANSGPRVSREGQLCVRALDLSLSRGGIQTHPRRNFALGFISVSKADFFKNLLGRFVLSRQCEGGGGGGEVVGKYGTLPKRLLMLPFLMLQMTVKADLFMMTAIV